MPIFRKKRAITWKKSNSSWARPSTSSAWVPPGMRSYSADMFEVEAKVRISPREVSRLRREIRSFAVLKGKSVKKDSYFAPLDGYLRIREAEGQATLTLKIKKMSSGAEMNREIDFPLFSKIKTSVLVVREVSRLLLTLYMTLYRNMWGLAWHCLRSTFATPST